MLGGHLSPSDPLDPPGGSLFPHPADTRTDDTPHALIKFAYTGIESDFYFASIILLQR